jgi:hypothetical protein
MGLGVFLLPLILVKSGVLLIGDPPQEAVASGGAMVDPGAVIEVFTPEWSLEQVAATHRVVELREEPFGESPLLHPRKISDIDPIQTVENPTITPPTVSVQMILRSRRGNVALINRKRFRVGDAIGEDGWFIEKIDAVTRSVLIVHRASEVKATLVVPMPR